MAVFVNQCKIKQKKTITILQGRNSNVSGLYVRRVHYKHAGLYECRAQTPIHAISQSAILSVDGNIKPILFF